MQILEGLLLDETYAADFAEYAALQGIAISDKGIFNALSLQFIFFATDD